MSAILEEVGAGQARFMTPGVSLDTRGVLMGRYGILQFSSIEGIVTWLRLYSAEASLDELLPKMKIQRARNSLQSKELLLQIPALSSYLMDTAMRCARLAGGSLYTGTAKHFVQYRDERSPFGYDAVQVGALPAGTHLMLHAREFTQAYIEEGELSFEKLLFRLSLKRVPGSEQRYEESDRLLLAVERGLAEGIVRYLWRNDVKAEATLVRPISSSSFDDGGSHSGFLLVRVHALPLRILKLFRSTPGIEVFQEKASNIGLEFGYRHVIDLGSCGSAFSDDKFYLFWGVKERVEIVEGPLTLSPISHLTSLSIDLEGPERQLGYEGDTFDTLAVPIRLVPSSKIPTKVVGALIPVSALTQLKKLVYLLPPAALRSYRIANTDRGVLVVSSGSMDVIPLGELLIEAAPGLLIPCGAELVPRVAPEVLAASLGHSEGLQTVYPSTGTPFQIEAGAMQPLERKILANIEVEKSFVTILPESTLDTAIVENSAVGGFALWGFQGQPEKDS